MVSTGFKKLDDVLTGLRIGDNVVWQVDDIKEYMEYVTAFVTESLAAGKKVVYMRFAAHPQLVKPAPGVSVYELDSNEGFESFSTEVNAIITREGIGAHYVFDSLSDLLPAWATDLMIGNFFMVTCPYLYELDTIAYFALIRNYHSYKTIARIRETTQLLIDVYDCNGEYYVHPLKVWNRYSPTMFLPHLKQGDKFTPITDSVEATKALCYMKNPVAEGGKRNLDYWDRLFMKGEELLSSNAPMAERRNMVELFSNVMISKDPKILALVEENFSLEDLVEVKSRMIGTGIIGGKAVGMLLARKLLSKNRELKWEEWSEPHDSFYIGSDVFYSYIVQNGWWKLRIEQKTEQGYFDAAKVLGEKMLHGKFPEEIREQFQRIMEYFGQSPIIVRSSSLLEDGFGNAFAGKYDSFFLSNQGSPEERFIKFIEAVRRIYASTMSEDALVYRRQRGLDNLDEQMALLVQRVSGAYHGNYFFPDIAGVGISYNTYVWNKDMSPEAGMVRVVAGLGTRAVNRVEGDYPRIAALDRPLLRPNSGRDDIVKYSQREVDVINISKNEFETISLEEASSQDVDYLMDEVAIRDHEGMRLLSERGIERNEAPWVITFDKFFSEGDFIGNIKKLMKTLEKGYSYPVDIEFTINFSDHGKYRVNLLQCRPLQTRGLGKKVSIPADIKKENIMFSSAGCFLGGNVSQNIYRIIYVDPEKYVALNESDKYDVARAVGKLNRKIQDRNKTPTLLLGPGRWGTSTPSLGVPVSFSEINNMAVLGEISFAGGNLVPELSFGTHFFQDLVETEIFYVAIFPERSESYYNKTWTGELKDTFSEELPDYSKYSGIISVYDVKERGLKILSDMMAQKMVCYNSVGTKS
ncbi:MAG: PEP/pyruvate-binding domain-containing protein [Candidatus Omnitrophota bacterium]